MTSPYSGGTKPPTPDTNVEISKIVSDVADGKPTEGPIKVIVIKQEVEEPSKRGGHKSTIFLLVSLFILWAVVGSIAKDAMLKATTPAYGNTKEIRNHPWLSKLALSQVQIDESIAFTRQYEACENNTFITAGWDAFVLYRSKMRLNKVMGVEDGSSTTTDNDNGNLPRGVLVVEVNYTSAKNVGLKKGAIIYYYDGKPINSTDDFQNAKVKAKYSGKDRASIVFRLNGRTHDKFIEVGQLGARIQNRKQRK